MEKAIIDSDDAAFEWLERYLEGGMDADDVEFQGWPKLNIRLDGDKFQGTLTPSVMKGFVELQASIYRSYALSRYGVPNAGRLTKEEREDLEIQVSVDKGSTLLGIDFQELLLKWGDKMEPVHLAFTLVGLGVVMGSTVAFKAYLNQRRDIRMAEVKSESERMHLATMKFMSEQETKRTEVMARTVHRDPMLDNTSRFIDDGRGELLKGLSKADSAAIDGMDLDPDDTAQLLRNARRKASEVRLDGHYRILRNDTTDPTAFKVKVRNVHTNAEFEALVQDESLNDRYKQLLQRAEWDRSPVQLSINAKSLEDDIRNAVVIRVEPIPEEGGE